METYSGEAMEIPRKIISKWAARSLHQTQEELTFYETARPTNSVFMMEMIGPVSIFQSMPLA
jgi:hypothetical protein